MKKQFVWIFVALIFAASSSFGAVTWQAEGVVVSANIATGATKTICLLPDGGEIGGLERVILNIQDEDEELASIICRRDTACECAAATLAGTAVAASGVVIDGRLIVLEVEIQ